MEERASYSVGDLTFYIKHRLESDSALRDVTVTGEVSNLTRHNSGHVYFTLKDDRAQISCAMFRSAAQRYVRHLPRHGQQVTVRAQVSVYAPQGRYQLIVRAIQTSGQGDLHRRFLELRDRLQGEGLFAAEHKQPIPRFPRRIGIVTSPTGAVIRDISDTVRRRFPHVELVLAPAKVQGEEAAATLIAALDLLHRAEAIDVILLGRGGGSLEDLWCFNDEGLARAIFAAEIPIIAGIGHETDVTIADFVADQRAPTPTAAAELAVPVADELRTWLDDASTRFRHNLGHFVDSRRQMLDDLTVRLEMRMQHQIEFRQQLLDKLQYELRRSTEEMMAQRRGELSVLQAQFEALDARKVLARGYTVTELNGERITDATDLAPGDELTTHFLRGSALSQVKKTRKTDE
ncbi:MAG: exodeoxyribonuclease VII large subunit [Bacteroidota bacterium]